MRYATVSPTRPLPGYLTQPATKIIPVERAIVRRGDTGELPAYLQRDEIAAMVRVADNPRDRMLLRTLWNTGGRVSEVLALRRSDLDPAARSLRLANLKRRRGAEKTIYLTPDFTLELLSYCEEHALRGDAFIFTAKKGRHPISRQMAYRIFGELGERAGLEREVHPHMTRHGFAIHCLRSGVPLTVVKDQLGHASILTTLVYTRMAAPEIREMMAKVTF